MRASGSKELRADRARLHSYYWRTLKLIWACDRKGALKLLIATLVSGFAAPAELWVWKWVIDAIVTAVNPQGVPPHVILWHAAWLLLIQVSISFIALATERWLNTLRSVQGTKLNYHVQRLGLEKASSLDLAFFESPSFHDMFQRAVDRPASDAQNVLLHLSFVVSSSATLVSVTLMLLQLHWLVIPSILLVTLPLAYCRVRFARRRFALNWSHAPSLRMVNYLIRLLGSRESAMEIRLYGLAQTLLARLSEVWGTFVKENRALVVSEQRTELLLDVPVALMLAGIGFYALNQAVAGAITVGSMVLYFQAAKSAALCLDNLFTTGSTVYGSGLSVRELFLFLDLDPQSMEGALRRGGGRPTAKLLGNSCGSLELLDVSFRYPGTTKYVLENVSFRITAGERVALVGSNGAGKTTIVKLLTRLYEPTTGQILLDGRPLDQYDLADLRAQYGVLFQDFVKYHFSVRENVGFGHLERLNDTDRLEQAARDAGCLQMIEKLPSGFDTILGRALTAGVDISGGEWQKLALARAFMRQAKVVILDEPSAALDALAEARLNRDMELLAEGRTSILISHRLSMVQSMDRVFVLHGGRLVQTGSHKELMLCTGLYSRMYNLQASRYRDSADALAREAVSAEWADE